MYFIAGLDSCAINGGIYFIAAFILFYWTWNDGKREPQRGIPVT